jgi:cytidine deaminase
MYLTRTIRVNVVTFKELSLDIQRLIRSAIEVRDHAQAPYSGYAVGAALLTESGCLYVGCNVERASYTQTTHAEQNAIDTMVATEGPQKISSMAIIGAPRGTPRSLFVESIESVPMEKQPIAWEQVCPSCGHCLQIIWENSMGDSSVALYHVFTNGMVACTTIGDALPMRFGPSELGIDIRSE